MKQLILAFVSLLMIAWGAVMLLFSALIELAQFITRRGRVGLLLLLPVYGYAQRPGSPYPTRWEIQQRDTVNELRYVGDVDTLTGIALVLTAKYVMGEGRVEYTVEPVAAYCLKWKTYPVKEALFYGLDHRKIDPADVLLFKIRSIPEKD